MGAVIRLTDDIEKRLKAIDENPHKALRIVIIGYADHKEIITQQKKLMDEIIAKLDDLISQVDNLKSY